MQGKDCHWAIVLGCCNFYLWYLQENYGLLKVELPSVVQLAGKKEIYSFLDDEQADVSLSQKFQ